MMFSRNGTNNLREKFGRLMEGIFRKLICEQQNSDLSNERIEFLSCYRTQGCLAVVEKWVQNDYSESEKFIVGILSDLDSNTEKLVIKK